jgi:uncharacterized protein YhbP (UPF0306 family)
MKAILKVTNPHQASGNEVSKSLELLLKETALFTMATIGRKNIPHVNNAFFFWDQRFRLGFLSLPDSAHVRNFGFSKYASVSVAKSGQIWGRPIKGVQLVGTIREVRASETEFFFRAYAARFKSSLAYCKELLNSKLPKSAKAFYFEPYSFKLIDEKRFGEEVFIQGTLKNGGLNR